MTKKITAEQTEARAELARLLPVGSTVTTIVRHVSRSGMSRSISVLIGEKDGGVWDLDYLIVRAGLGAFDRTHGGIKVNGAGMDMGFALVHGISRAIHADFRCAGHDGSKRAPRCPSNDHSNDRTPDFRRGRRHSDGGYAVSQRWL